jgi:hypothetical protein
MTKSATFADFADEQHVGLIMTDRANVVALTSPADDAGYDSGEGVAINNAMRAAPRTSTDIPSTSRKSTPTHTPSRRRIETFTTWLQRFSLRGKTPTTSNNNGHTPPSATIPGGGMKASVSLCKHTLYE